MKAKAGWGGPGGTHAVQEVWRFLADRPEQCITETLKEMRRRTGLALHEPFMMAAYGREVSRQVPSHRGLRKMVTLLSHLFDLGYGDGVGTSLEGARLFAHLLQAFKVV